MLTQPEAPAAAKQIPPGEPIPSFAEMCAAEPFRVFFPLGLAAGVVGLALWPLHLLGVMTMYPGLIHARVMVEGFLACFVLGFLGTAGPRLLSAPHFTGRELALLVALELAALASHLSGRILPGDACFLAVLTGFAVILGQRFAARAELPPPNFVLVGFGLLNALAGAAIVTASSAFPDYPRLYLFGSLALSQGFVLLPVLGIGAFLFPRFLSVPFGAELAELRKPTPWWKRQACFALLTGACIVASFGVESAGFLLAAGALRFGAAAAYVGLQMPAVLKFTRAPLLGQSIRASVWLLLAGLLWPVFLPAYRVAGLHLVFIGGFMLTTLSVATRVILGHTGQVALCKKPLPFLIVSVGLLLLGLVARVAADFLPTIAARNQHLVWASLACIAAAVVWGSRLLPRITIPDSE
jgi:uncharacterized protein involved in response to NO